MNLPTISDWRIHPEQLGETVYMARGQMHRVAMGSSEWALAARICAALSEQAVHLGSRGAVMVDGLGYRIERFPNGFYAARVLTPSVPTLEDLAYPPAVRALLLNEQLGALGGVILIVGEAGSGKSHTAAATVVDRLRLGLANYAITYENPPEFQMQGFHGAGYLDQNSIPEGDYACALAHSLRCFPAQGRSILFVGELLDGDSAAAFCRVAMTGNLGLSTLHGRDIIAGIQRWFSLSGADHSMAIRDVIASSLRLVVHQELIAHPGQPPRLGIVQALKVTEAAQSYIRQGTLHLLATEIENTQRLLRLQQGAHR